MKDIKSARRQLSGFYVKPEIAQMARQLYAAEFNDSTGRSS